MWQVKRPDPQPIQSIMDTGKIRLTIEEMTTKRWQHFSLSLGAFTEEPHEICLKTWPREAIRLAREELNRFEARLDGEGD